MDDWSDDQRTRLYRELKEPHDPARAAGLGRFDGTDFTDCPFTALQYAGGRRGEPADCRARGYLADALFAQERQAEARIGYRDALALAPTQVDLLNVVDPSVRDLPSLAEDEYELPDAPVEWAAAVGLLEGLFIPPQHLPDDWVGAERIEGLAPGVRFYRWLVAEKLARDDARRIACRRAMKALSPRLFRELLERRG